MKTFFRICMALMFCGALSLMAADGDTTQQSGGRGENGGHGGPGKRRGHGGRGNVTFLVCPNCHHKLVVRALPDRGHGPGGKEGRDGRDGERRGPRGMRRGRGQRTTTQQDTTQQQTTTEDTK